MAAHGVGCLLGKTPKEPTCLEFVEQSVFDQAAQAIRVQHRQRVSDGQTDQKDFGLVRRVDVLLELRHQDGVQGIAFKVGAVGALLMRYIPVFVVGRETRKPD